MAVRPVHWHEGMFLRPHHFQALERYWSQQVARGDKFDQHYNWGLAGLDLDLDALANYRFAIRSLKARLRDGTAVSVPEDGILPTLDLKTAFEQENQITIFLAVPVLHLGRANLSANGQADNARYRLDTQELEDENTGVNPQSVQVNLLNLKLLLSTQDHTGYEVLPIAKLEKSPKAEAVPQLADTYIPPLLSCDAWKPLSAGILEQLYDRIGKKLELLAGQVVTRGITFDSGSQGDQLIFEQLRILNEASAWMGIVNFAQGIHPFLAYLELVRLVGGMAIFGATRRTPEIPPYDHDNLGECFYRVKVYLDALLNILVEPEYKERAFVGAGLRMQVSLEPIWLESIWQMFIGVQSPIGTDEVVNLLTRAGRLDMKIASSDRVDEIFRLGMAGLQFAHTPRPPRALPSMPGLIYFQINREARLEEWQNVQRSLTLAIRLNEHLIAGNIQGQRVLSIKTAGQTTTMQFTLYVVPQEKKS